MDVNEDMQRESEPTPAGDLSDEALRRELAELVERTSRGEVAGTAADRSGHDARISDLRAEAAERAQPQDEVEHTLDFPGSDAPPESPAD